MKPLPANPGRRRFLLDGAAVACVGAVPLAGCSGAARQHLGGYGDALRALEFYAAQASVQGRGQWNPSQIFQHCAQSIEYSLQGFPALRSAVFRDTVGAVAASVFAGWGQMRHDLAEPIPGAAVLLPELPMVDSLRRLRQAFEAFHAHRGPMQPHFAYGALPPEDYLFAHVLHLDNHLDELVPLPPFLRAGGAA